MLKSTLTARLVDEVVDRPEAGVLDAVVRHEPQPEVAVGAGDHVWERAAAVPTDHVGVAVQAVTHLERVVLAADVPLHHELVPEVQSDDLTFRRCNST